MFRSRSGTAATSAACSTPMVLAKLLQAAEIGPADRVLDVGAATGYSAAMLARLAGSVVALEQDEALAGRAREALSAVGVSNVEVAVGPLIAGMVGRRALRRDPSQRRGRGCPRGAAAAAQGRRAAGRDRGQGAGQGHDLSGRRRRSQRAGRSSMPPPPCFRDLNGPRPSYFEAESIVHRFPTEWVWRESAMCDGIS